MPRDALWVLPNGEMTVVTVDDDGNLMEPFSDAVRETLVEPVPEPAKTPDPPPPQTRKRGRHRRR
jgi:hypothetical protein